MCACRRASVACMQGYVSVLHACKGTFQCCMHGCIRACVCECMCTCQCCTLACVRVDVLVLHAYMRACLACVHVYMRGEATCQSTNFFISGH